jgi:hypothetical protein
MPDPLFERLYTATRSLPAAPVEQIAARGRQRARRQRWTAVAAVCAAALVIATASLALPERRADTPDPVASPEVTSTAPPAPSSTQPTPDRSSQPAPSTGSSGPTLTSVPAGAMLRPQDVGQGSWTVEDNPDAEGDWHFEFVLGYCPAYRPGPARPSHVDRRLRDFTSQGGATGMTQEVKLYRSDDARDAFTWYRDGATACADHRSVFGGTQMTVTIVAENFVGDRSMLVLTRSAHGTGMYGFVVHGRLLTQFTVAADTEQAGRQLARKAYDRMCAVAGGC